MSLGPQCLGPQCLLKGLGPQCPDLNVWDLNVRDLIVIAPNLGKWYYLKAGHKCPVFEWFEPFKFRTSKPSGFRMNPDFECPEFGSLLYSNIH